MSHYAYNQRCMHCHQPVIDGDCFTQGCPGRLPSMPDFLPVDPRDRVINAIIERCRYSVMKRDGIAEYATDGGLESGGDLARDILNIIGVYCE